MADFLIGAATAAHQVEGNNIYSDCWAAEHIKHSSYVEPSEDAVDHYNRYEEDIRLLANAGGNAYRFSIEWARIEPQFGTYSEKEIAHYKDVIECCEKHNVTPIVTLHHFSSPAWLMAKGGWGSENVVEYFAKYCGYVAEKLGDKLTYVCTINEANMGYQLQKVAADMMKASKKKEGAVQVGVKFDIKAIILGMFEQGKVFQCNPLKIKGFLNPRSIEEEKIVMRAHQAAKQAMKKVNPNLKIGLTLSLFDYQTLLGGEENAAKLWHEDFGFYLPYIKDDDFLGVQNYSRKRVDASGELEPEDGASVTQMGYEDYPQAIGNVLRKVAKEFSGELIVTENGISTDKDERRCGFIKEAFAGVKAAIEEGVPVKGYFYWSLLDNFEWQAGYSKTFGLIAVDRSTQKRYPKESLWVLGSMKL